MPLTIRSKTIVNNLVIGSESGGSSRNTFLVASSYGANSQKGISYVYDATDFSISPTIISGSSSTDYRNGRNVAISGDYIAMSGDYNDNYSGSVYVFDANSLTSEPTKLTPTDLGPNDYFGSDIGLSSNYLVVGMKNDDDLATNAGAIYVYTLSDLSQSPTKIKPGSLGASDSFGERLSVSDSHIVVSAMRDDDVASDSGAVYVFDISNLSSSPTKLTVPSGGQNNDFFGTSVDCNDNYIVVGSIGGPGYGGSVFVYDASNLSASPTEININDSGAQFGSSVAVSDDYLCVYALGDDTNGTDGGAVYVYDITDLSQSPTKIVSNDGGANDRFGTSISINGDTIAVGAWLHDDNSVSNTGAVYIFDGTDLSATPTKIVPSTNSGDLFGYSIQFG